MSVDKRVTLASLGARVIMTPNAPPSIPWLVKLGARDLAETAARMLQLRELLWNKLASEVNGLALKGHPEQRLPNTLNVRFPRASGPAVLDGAASTAQRATRATKAPRR